ncbi:trypsin-like peptidase domain-containing protein [Phormidium sp. FACHB-592]|uniref:Serine protease n=1 Tax=Stenomitos frigidus AS-A4 TaxID=2933935 RepID=A0ABV0KD79_9CYAN|nr:serine protease [Phormidium sp. FACHB-592]MBD2077813.1 trypsin-like peptidase domain-containing protein [Phormidium sp. FACHB-592]
MRTQVQNLISFTVQIVAADKSRVIGTGIVVSMDGKIITCSHVFEMAGASTNECGSSVLNICFPKNRYRDAKLCQAKLVANLSEHDDDILLLKAIDPPLLSSEQVAVLGTAEFSIGNPFRSYGFRQLGDSPSGYAVGEILGPVLPFINKKLLVEPVELRTRDIRPGMSGAGILDVKRNLLIGLISRRWNPGDQSSNDNIAWGVDNLVLTFNPFHSVPFSND